MSFQEFTFNGTDNQNKFTFTTVQNLDVDATILQSRL